MPEDSNAKAASLKEGGDIDGEVDLSTLAGPFYVSCNEWTDIPIECCSIDDDNTLMTFDTFESCQKHATKKNSFKRKLLQKCQQEFSSSVDRGPDTEYATVQDKIRELIAKKATYTDQEEYAFYMSEHEDQLATIKKRMLGNVRFIGELCKLKLLNAKVMHECMNMLLCEFNNDSGEYGTFKKQQDEYDLEMCCKLIHTVGKILDTFAVEKYKATWQGILNELHRIRTDTSKYGSRTRFSIDEVFELKKNRWRARREEEGPATIQQIHENEAKEFEEAKKAAELKERQMNMRGGYGSMDRRDGGRGGNDRQFTLLSRNSGDARNATGRNSGDARGMSSSSDNRQDGPRGSTFSGGLRGSMASNKNSNDARNDGRNKGNKNDSRNDNRNNNKDKQSNSRNNRDSNNTNTSTSGRETINLSSMYGGKDNKGDKGGSRGSTASKSVSPAVSANVSNNSSKNDLPSAAKDSNGATTTTSGGGSASGMSADQLEKRAVGLIDELLRVGLVDESFLTVQELGPAIVGAIVTRILVKFVDVAKKEKQKLLLELLNRLEVYLVERKSDVEKAIEECEYLITLPDTILDAQQAPEWLGDVVGTLASLGAVDLVKLQSIVDNNITINIDEMMAIEEETKEAYAKFMDIVKAY